MSDPFVPEADALDQQREVAPPPEPEQQGEGRALKYPDRIPLEASEADVLEQGQEVDYDDEDR